MARDKDGAYGEKKGENKVNPVVAIAVVNIHRHTCSDLLRGGTSET